MNKQNPDRGIETSLMCKGRSGGSSMNKQNPDRGIETFLSNAPTGEVDEYEQTESRPRD